MSVPRSDDERAVAAADAVFAAVRDDPRPVLALCGERDLILTLASVSDSPPGSAAASTM
jgi:hypothetical protein